LLGLTSARRHHQHRDSVPGPAVREESRAAAEFDVVGMSANGKDIQNDSSRLISTWVAASALAPINAILDRLRLWTELHIQTTPFQSLPSGL